jgi:hypothetical protein
MCNTKLKIMYLVILYTVFVELDFYLLIFSVSVHADG